MMEIAVNNPRKDHLPKRFLRRPLPPKQLPTLPLTPPANRSETESLTGKFLVEPEFYYEQGDFPPRGVDYQFDRSGTSPPPPSEHHTNTTNTNKFKASTISTLVPKSNDTKNYNRSDGRYILDPFYREHTSLGTYVQGKALVQPKRPRGPCPLPARLPVKTTVPAIPFIDSDEFLEEARYHEHPQFTLKDFLQTVSEAEDLPLIKVQEMVFSKHNYKKIQALLVEHMNPKCTTLTKVTMQPSESMPHVTPRIPQKQLLIEMAALIKEQMITTIGTNIKPLIRPLPKYSPDYKPGKPTPHTEIVLYEDRAKSSRFIETTQPGGGGNDKMLNSAQSRYFQGSRRSSEPFNLPDEDSITPQEMAVLDALVNGGTALSLKAMFVAQLPDISMMISTLTYLNISFNDFEFIPYEVFELEHLTSLKLRNNPIREIPVEIDKLKKLQILVFSFCLVSVLPVQLFSLKKLHHLDFSYNKVTFIPNEIRKLKHLRELNTEGNHLGAFPMGVLRLQYLKYVRVRNNYMHPIFWQQSSRNTAQRLSDLALLIVFSVDYNKGYQEGELPDGVQKQLENYTRCDCCRSVQYGEGLQFIRPVSKVFGIRNLPIMFRCCTPQCLQDFKHNTHDSLKALLYGENR